MPAKKKAVKAAKKPAVKKAVGKKKIVGDKKFSIYASPVANAQLKLTDRDLLVLAVGLTGAVLLRVQTRADMAAKTLRSAPKAPVKKKK